MKGDDLNKWMRRWALRPIDGAKVLGIEEALLMNYLNDGELIPKHILTHIETFDSLDEKVATKIIQKRISEVAMQATE